MAMFRIKAIGARIERPSEIVKHSMERAPSSAPALAYRLLPQNYGHVPDACNQVEGPPGDDGELFEKGDPVDKHPDGDGVGLPVGLCLGDHLKR